MIFIGPLYYLPQILKVVCDGDFLSVVRAWRVTALLRNQLS